MKHFSRLSHTKWESKSCPIWIAEYGRKTIYEMRITVDLMRSRQRFRMGRNK